MRRFFLVLYGLTALFQVSFVLACAEALGRLGAGSLRWGFALGLGVITTVGLRGRVRLGASDRPITPMRGWLLEEPYYVHWGATVWATFGLVLGAAASGAAAAAGRAWPGLGAIALVAYATGLPVAFYAVVLRRRWVRVRRVVVPVRALPEALVGLTIAQLSDVHVGAMTPGRRVQRWVARANALGADLVALTGDYVTSGVAFHDEIAEVFGELRAPLGVFAVPGNHDYFGEGEPLFRRLRDRGITVLRNEARALSRGGASFTLVGVDDVWTRRADVDATMNAAPEGLRPVLALAHDPKLFPALADRGADVVLSGHTHWGQVALPFLPRIVNFARLAFDLHAGEVTRGDATLVISPGLGTTGPPFRLGSPPEITLVELVRA